MRPLTFLPAPPWSLLLLGVSVFMLGCSESPNCRVSGNVTLDGQPVADGMLMFIPAGQAPELKTVSALIENGQYVVERPKGLLPGTYKVAVTSEQPSGKKIEADPGSGVMIDEFVQVIPEKYNAQSTLTAEIAGDRDDLNFELTRR